MQRRGAGCPLRKEVRLVRPSQQETPQAEAGRGVEAQKGPWHTAPAQPTLFPAAPQLPCPTSFGGSEPASQVLRALLRARGIGWPWTLPRARALGPRAPTAGCPGQYSVCPWFWWGLGAKGSCPRVCLSEVLCALRCCPHARISATAQAPRGAAGVAPAPTKDQGPQSWPHWILLQKGLCADEEGQLGALLTNRSRVTFY